MTANGLLFIGATTYDNTFHAFDKRDGQAAVGARRCRRRGTRRRRTYMVDGVQYIVIACGGGKNGAKSGGTYVAFALPKRAATPASSR